MTAVNTAEPGMEREELTAHGRSFGRPSVVLARPVLHALFPSAAAYRGGGFGVFKPSPRNSEDTGGDLDRTSKKNQRLDFLL